jgi:hypothetical protein
MYDCMAFLLKNFIFKWVESCNSPHNSRTQGNKINPIIDGSDGIRRGA